MFSRISRIFKCDVESLDPMKDWRLQPMTRSLKKALLLQEMVAIAPYAGSLVECGVGAGFSLSILAAIRRSEDQKLFGFDSYEGFPSGGKFDSPDFKAEEKTAYFEMDIDFVKNNLIRAGVAQVTVDDIRFIKGYFPSTFNQYDGGGISVLNLDVDLYDSYKVCLNKFYPMLLNGGVVIFDEYDSPNDMKKWPGAKRAIDEFTSEFNLKLQKHWTGFAYVQKI